MLCIFSYGLTQLLKTNVACVLTELTCSPFSLDSQLGTVNYSDLFELQQLTKLNYFLHYNLIQIRRFKLTSWLVCFLLLNKQKGYLDPMTCFIKVLKNDFQTSVWRACLEKLIYQRNITIHYLISFLTCCFERGVEKEIMACQKQNGFMAFEAIKTSPNKHCFMVKDQLYH